MVAAWLARSRPNKYSCLGKCAVIWCDSRRQHQNAKYAGEERNEEPERRMVKINEFSETHCRDVSVLLRSVCKSIRTDSYTNYTLIIVWDWNRVRCIPNPNNQTHFLIFDFSYFIYHFIEISRFSLRCVNCEGRLCYGAEQGQQHIPAKANVRRHSRKFASSYNYYYRIGSECACVHHRFHCWLTATPATTTTNFIGRIMRVLAFHASQNEIFSEWLLVSSPHPEPLCTQERWKILSTCLLSTVHSIYCRNNFPRLLLIFKRKFFVSMFLSFSTLFFLSTSSSSSPSATAASLRSCVACWLVRMMWTLPRSHERISLYRWMNKRNIYANRWAERALLQMPPRTTICLLCGCVASALAQQRMWSCDYNI